MTEPFHEANERLRERKRIENDKDAEIERLEAALQKIQTQPGNARDCRRIAAEALAKNRAGG